MPAQGLEGAPGFARLCFFPAAPAVTQTMALIAEGKSEPAGIYTLPSSAPRRGHCHCWSHGGQEHQPFRARRGACAETKGQTSGREGREETAENVGGASGGGWWTLWRMMGRRGRSSCSPLWTLRLRVLICIRHTRRHSHAVSVSAWSQSRLCCQILHRQKA